MRGRLGSGVAQAGEENFALMGVGAVLPQVDALPGSELEAGVADGDGEADEGEGHADVGGHIVGSFVAVEEGAIAIGDESAEEGFEVFAHGGVGVFVDEEGGAGVLDEEGAEAAGDGGSFDGLVDLGGELVDASSGGVDEEGVVGADHGVSSVLRGRLRWWLPRGGACRSW